MKQTVLALLILLLMPQSISARCLDGSITVKGVIVEECANTPLEQVVVVPFLDDEQQASHLKFSAYRDFAVSGSEGEFAVHSSYYPGVSWSMEQGHDCSGRPEQVTLIFMVDGYRIRREVVHFNNSEELLPLNIFFTLEAPVELKKFAGQDSCGATTANKSLNTDTSDAGAG